MIGNRQRRLIVIFSIVLWAQLVFTLGLGIWRYWNVYNGQFEVFVGNSPKLADPLIESSYDYCADDAQIYYVGPSEADTFYVRYQLYPRKVARLWVDQDIEVTQEMLEDRFPGLSTHDESKTCLLVDRLKASLTGKERVVEINQRQAIYILD